MQFIVIVIIYQSRQGCNCISLIKQYEGAPCLHERSVHPSMRSKRAVMERLANTDSWSESGAAVRWKRRFFLIKCTFITKETALWRNSCHQDQRQRIVRCLFCCIAISAAWVKTMPASRNCLHGCSARRSCCRRTSSQNPSIFPTHPGGFHPP